MNQTFAALTALSLTMILWGFGRKPRNPLLKSNDESFGTGLNRNQLTLVKTESAKKRNKANFLSHEEGLQWQIPKSPNEKLELIKQLKKAMQSDPEMRLKAIQFASLWNDPLVLSLIRLGRKDSDSRVVIAAAKVLERYRGKPRKANHSDSRPPRNVALMR